MKKIGMIISVLSLLMFVACSEGNSNANELIGNNPKTVEGKTLVVYFSQTLPKGVDATTGATNVVRENGNNYGAAQYLALMIARKTNADTLRLTVAEGHYPLTYDDLAAFARTERDNNSRPALTSRKVNLSNYENVIIGTPIWWYTIPMPVYSFLDSYDLSGKNVFIFTTHAGSGLADAVSVIRREEPNARVVPIALAVTASQVSAKSSSEVDQWLSQIGLQ